ncbi:MAG: tRNA (cytidine(34)-2'-O)-methyltransferase [Pseudomonadota bacterium]
MVRIALYQPDIPSNAGTILRLASCLGIPVDLIEPAGFTLTDKALHRAGLDYLDRAALYRHVSWDIFLQSEPVDGARLVLATTKAAKAYTDFAFRPGDIILLGRETAGVPDSVHEAATARITIPMRPEARSLNVAVAAAMICGEALRQVSGFASASQAIRS